MIGKWKSPDCENPSCQNRSWRARFRPYDQLRLQGRRYCSLECLQQSMEQLLSRLLPAATTSRGPARSHRLPLGLLLYSEGWINEENLKAALTAQRNSKGGRIGDWFRKLGAVSEHQIVAALAKQWSRPVFSFQGNTSFLGCSGLIPFPLLESSSMVPVHYLPQSGHLYIAFADGIDYSALYGIERMLDCQTEPCLTEQSSLQWALDQIRQQRRPPEVTFDSIRNPKEMARATASYASKVGAEDIRVAQCNRFFWIQLRVAKQITNLLFNVPASKPIAEPLAIVS